jgi:hypothetical protein
MFIHINDEKKSGRSYIKLGVILTIISIILVAIWTIYYFLFIYRYRVVYIGMGVNEPGNYM